MVTSAATHHERIQVGTPRFWRANAALFIAGFATFASLYDVQPLLPALSKAFRIAPATASLSLSVATLTLAFSMLLIGWVADTWGRKPPMTASLAASAVLTLLCATAHNFSALIALRALEGVALSGLPAIAMAYLGEEVDPKSIGLAMGLYVGGTGIGGMCGRLLTGFVTDDYGWRAALVCIGTLGIVCAIVFQLLLPISRNFAPRRLPFLDTGRALAGHLRDAGLPWLYAVSFLLMGGFVSIYNYLGYRLERAPYHLSQSDISLIFTVYLVGTLASALMGRLADRLGRRNVLWAAMLVMLIGVLLTLAAPLTVIVFGMAMLTVGFFGGHSIASSWVGRRALTAKAQASSLYLCSYYIGSSLIGSLGGLAFTRYAWPGVALADSLVIGAAFLIAVIPLRRLPPLAENTI